MKNGFIIAGSIIGLLAIVCGGASTSSYNSLNAQEKGTTATWRDSHVQYDTFWKKVSEAAQIPGEYKADFKDVIMAPTEARYKGKDPAFMMITEANPTLDPSLYLQVQRILEAGRDDFA